MNTEKNQKFLAFSEMVSEHVYYAELFRWYQGFNDAISDRNRARKRGREKEFDKNVKKSGKRFPPYVGEESFSAYSHGYAAGISSQSAIHLSEEWFSGMLQKFDLNFCNVHRVISTSMLAHADRW